jgi:dTMP kinase
MNLSTDGLTGRFIVLEGGEGAGKTSLIAALETVLTADGHTVRRTREPGGSPSAEKIRAIVVSGSIDSLDAAAETLLFTAARRQHLRETILPALRRGEIVLCDRYLGSTLAYQGLRGVPEEDILDLHRRFCGGLRPHLTLVLDIPPEIGLARSGRRLAADGSGEGRFEQMDLDAHRKIRAAYLANAARDPDCHVVLDATQTPEQVLANALAALKARI